MTAAGYSGTPLAKKLGMTATSRVVLLGAPPGFRGMLDPLPVFAAKPDARTDIVHLFTAQRSELAKQLAALRKSLAPDAAIWVSWPKKASKVATDVTEDVIREVALPMGWVDVKVCAVDETWSGLKLVVRKELRK